MTRVPLQVACLLRLVAGCGDSPALGSFEKGQILLIAHNFSDFRLPPGAGRPDADFVGVDWNIDCPCRGVGSLRRGKGGRDETATTDVDLVEIKIYDCFPYILQEQVSLALENFVPEDRRADLALDLATPSRIPGAPFLAGHAVWPYGSFDVTFDWHFDGFRAADGHVSLDEKESMTILLEVRHGTPGLSNLSLVRKVTEAPSCWYGEPVPPPRWHGGVGG